MGTNAGYKHVALRVELVRQIENYIQEHKEEGYMSVPEFIREAIRMNLKEIPAKK